jgi:hypothetical protein
MYSWCCLCTQGFLSSLLAILMNGHVFSTRMAGDGAVDDEEDGEDASEDIVQQLLCSFIELASHMQGAASTRSLEQVGQLLATQRPLVLAAQRASWLPQLLYWLSRFLTMDGQETSQESSSVRGTAAAAMLDLGVCSGSLCCILLTIESLLSNTMHPGQEQVPDGATGVVNMAIDCQRVIASVRRLWTSCCDMPSSSPTGGCTYFFPVLQLESRIQALRTSPAQAASARTIAYSRSQLIIKSLPPNSESKFVTVATDGSFLYVHSTAGLAKLGTGYNGTIQGHLYACKPRYRVLEKPWMACVGTRLYMRSPAMAPDCLVVLDCSTLEEVGNVRTDGKGSVSRALSCRFLLTAHGAFPAHPVPSSSASLDAPCFTSFETKRFLVLSLYQFASRSFCVGAPADLSWCRSHKKLP